MNTNSAVVNSQLAQNGELQVPSLRPGGEITKRKLHMIILSDVSGSMDHDGKIQALNNAIRDAIPAMQKTASQNPQADVYVRGLAFSDDVRWIVENPVPIADFKWTPMSASGQTAMGKALSTIAMVLNVPPMDARGFPPAVILISDGQPTDDFDAGLQEFMSKPWGKKAIRLAIGIGKDANKDVLGRFIGNPEIPVLQANNPEMLTRFLRFASTMAIQSASRPTGSGVANAGLAAASGMSAAVPGTSGLQVW